MQTDSTLLSINSSFSKVLASGNGSGNSALVLWWAMWIITGVAGCVWFAYIANDLKQRQGQIIIVQGPSIEQRIAFLEGGAIFIPVLCLVYGILYHRSIASTCIQVDESIVEGKGAGKYFILGDPRIFGFRLMYNQITSIDTSGSTIIIHASGAQYKCYVQNPSEIQRVIVSQQQKFAHQATA